jgi:hypothetical protein
MTTVTLSSLIKQPDKTLKTSTLQTLGILSIMALSLLYAERCDYWLFIVIFGIYSVNGVWFEIDLTLIYPT